jgi:hypothetical protein
VDPDPHGSDSIAETRRYCIGSIFLDIWCNSWSELETGQAHKSQVTGPTLQKKTRNELENLGWRELVPRMAAGGAGAGHKTSVRISERSTRSENAERNDG